MQHIICAYSQIPQNSPSVYYETLLNNCVKRVLTFLHSNPQFKILLHLSISELEWIESNQPEINMLIYDLCKNGQIEMLASNYNDVMLPLIPLHRRTAQIEKSVTYIRKRFSKRPRGFWITQQYFSNSLIPSLLLSGMEYFVISGRTVNSGIQETYEPFWIDNMGKNITVFPSNYNYTELTAELYNGSLSEEKYISEIKKTVDIYSDQFDVIAINLDQIMNKPKACTVFETLYGSLGVNCTTPLVYMSECEITTPRYIAGGLYGRDIFLENNETLIQHIISNPLMRQNYCLLNMFREQIRHIKKKSDSKAILEAAFTKAESSSVYFTDIYFEIIKSIQHSLCETESLLCTENIMPKEYDIDLDRIPETIVQSGNFLLYLSSRGAVLSRVNFLPCLTDICSPFSTGIFCDSFMIPKKYDKSELRSHKYNISTLEKRRIDFYANSSVLEFGMVQLELSKKFKFRNNTINVMIEIENVGNYDTKGLIYENTINLALSEDCIFYSVDGQQITDNGILTQGISCYNPRLPFSVAIAFNEPVIVCVNVVYKNSKGYLGENMLYHYTQIKIQKKLFLGPADESYLGIGLKIEKRKESK